MADASTAAPRTKACRSALLHQMVCTLPAGAPHAPTCRVPPAQAMCLAFCGVQGLPAARLTAGACVEGGDDACFGHTDGLLLHHLVQLHTRTHGNTHAPGRVGSGQVRWGCRAGRASHGSADGCGCELAAKGTRMVGHAFTQHDDRPSPRAHPAGAVAPPRSPCCGRRRSSCQTRRCSTHPAPKQHIGKNFSRSRLPKP